MTRNLLLGLTIAWLAAGAPAASASLPYGAEYMDQSAFALGTFALNVVFVESNGAIDPNQEDWSGQQLDLVREQIDLAVDFWEGQTAGYHPNARLKFTVDYANDGVPLETRYEPITRPGTLSSAKTWSNDALSGLLYEGFPVHDADTLNEIGRLEHGANWATTVFVVNDAVDDDNRFTNGQFAFASIGGPSIVMTYGNDGWGIERFHRVLAHELGHTFFALDEYEESRVRNTVYSGYLNGVNGNAERNGSGQIIPAPQPHALMLDNSLAMSQFTKVQVGHVDSDGDSIPDILDSPPVLKNVLTEGDSDSGWFRFRALAEVTAIPNLNTYNLTLSSSGAPMTINWIDGAEYRLDLGDWIPFAAADGEFGDYVEGLDLLVDSIPRGEHLLHFRARNSVDLYSKVRSFPFMSNVPEPAGWVLAAGGIATVAMFRVRARRGR
ncbi:MAG: hypothetical protein SGJ19_03840 [Planctomycetia bacterium]|nr:hypothetical protein [Planctomycetia bacterium]